MSFKESSPATEGSTTTADKITTYGPKALPNLKALFRNTHVYVTVRFGKGAEVIYGGIVYWGFYDSVTGTVEKEEEDPQEQE